MKDYQTIQDGGAIQLPDSVRLATDDIAGTMREGLLAMAVSAGLGVMTALMEESVSTVGASSVWCSAERAEYSVCRGRSQRLPRRDELRGRVQSTPTVRDHRRGG